MLRPKNLRDLCDVLCTSKNQVYPHDLDIRIPFYRSKVEILNKYDRRKSGKEDIPTGEWIMATSINDCIEKNDRETLVDLVKHWYSIASTLTWNEQELLVNAWFGVLPSLQKYGGRKNTSS